MREPAQKNVSPSLTTPASIAAAVVKILKVEPGSYISTIMVLRDSSLSSSRLSRGGSLRSNDGLFAIATIPPVLTSITTMDADLDENSACAAVTAFAAKLCILASSDSVTLHPRMLGTYRVTLDGSSRPAMSVEV